MPKILDEIEQHSREEDKPILRWLFQHYHWESQWRFVATMDRQRYGTLSYQVNRVWRPTIEGVAIYTQLSDLTG